MPPLMGDAKGGPLGDLVGGDPKDKPWKDGSLLHEIFVAQAEKTPERIAVTDGTRSLTYEQVNDLTDRLAVWLQTNGAGPEKIVPIYMGRQIEYVVAYIAILKSCAAYLPMDVAYPMDLVAMVLDDSEPCCMLLTPDYLHNIKGKDMPTFVFDAGWEERLPPPGSKPVRPAGMTWDNMAYCVYSSGTTGQPKGICCPHKGSVLSYGWRSARYPYGPGVEREGCNVFFVWEMLRPLLNGQECWVIPDTVIFDVMKLPLFISEHKITRMLFTPSLLEAMLGEPGMDSSLYNSLRLIVLCGEVVTVQLRNKTREMVPGTTIHNLYSISECHDIAGSNITEDSSLDLTRTYCPVGKLHSFARVFILDPDFKEVPAGVKGEIYAAGPTLAHGYLRRPEMTAKRFVQYKGETVYRTGDLGYLVGGGDLEICGRCDSMVKVRGYSIELQAVQKALLEIPEVSDSVVVADGDIADTDKTLIAYLVPRHASDKAEAGALKRTVRAALKKRLPFYMVPTFLVPLDSIPVHAASGKLDKKGLPSLASIKADFGNDVEVAPATEAEKKVAAIFARVLNLPVQGLDVNNGFFDLGGNSLLTIPLLRDLSSEFDRSVGLEELFANPTIHAMAAMVTEAEGGRKLSPVAPRNLDDQVGMYASPSDVSIQMRAFWRHAEVEHLFKNHRVLLTGATGFLGAFLMREMLRTTRSYLYLLVRAGETGGGGLSPGKACRARVLRVMSEYGLLSPDVAVQIEQRVDVLVGDASLVRFGLDEEDHAYLAQHMDVVVHAAAQVNLLYPYDALVGANVRGTSHVLSFCQTGKMKALHYISTDAVFPVGPTSGSPGAGEDGRVYKEDEELRGESENLQGGYAQSKWVAEQIVRTSLNLGLPGTIYRCGNIGGDSASSAWNSKDSNLAMMRACVIANAVPIEDGVPLQFEMTPVVCPTP
ncbi:hypothetical protein T484DRAFT_1843426 [Baffinella frigidus]|nr:hypothetical protein T484DRAFT_1843426 [Cryptophyta sp. CCMP2293]